MVRPDDLVAVGDICAWAEEQCPVGMHVLEEPVVTIRHDLHVLGRYVIGDLEHLLVGVAYDDFAVVAPGCGRGLGGRKDLQDPVDLRQRVARKFL